MAPLGDNKDNVVVSNMKLERMLSMKGGKGEASYVNNSQAQVITFAVLNMFLYHVIYFFGKLFIAFSIVDITFVQP